MTKLWQKAVAVISELDEQEQDAMASIVLNELEDEKRWTKSQKALLTMAEEAWQEHVAGKTQRLDPDSLDNECGPA